MSADWTAQREAAIRVKIATSSYLSVHEDLRAALSEIDRLRAAKEAAEKHAGIALATEKAALAKAEEALGALAACREALAEVRPYAMVDDPDVLRAIAMLDAALSSPLGREEAAVCRAVVALGKYGYVPAATQGPDGRGGWRAACESVELAAAALVATKRWGGGV